LLVHVKYDSAAEVRNITHQLAVHCTYICTTSTRWPKK